MNYYNEFDPKTAAWLRELIRAGQIPPGEVDERSICDIEPHDLRGYTQCHFFAGIGGWSYALQLAGWPADRPVWTGSCPCQPFSSAGKQLGDKDERHLWPVFFRLIAECRPVAVFGEQVASAIGKGWLDGVSADLESEGYACGATVLGAHSVGAPHIRQRIYWVANSNGGESGNGELQCSGEQRLQPEGCGIVRMGNAVEPGLEGHAGNGDDRNKSGRINADKVGSVTKTGGVVGVDYSNSNGRESGRILYGEDHREEVSGGCRTIHWSRFDIVHCLDGKARRIEPGTFPLAHGVPGRVGLLRGYGNAIVPQVAAEFIQAFEECRSAVLSPH